MEENITKSDIFAQIGLNRVASIGWRNIRYETQPNWFDAASRNVILNRLNGCFEYHTLNAFMGPSGSGKTTLLNCLSGNRVKGLTQESEIFLHNDQHDGKVVSYFIEQHVEKTIVGGMRVGHILRYAYRFKNGAEGDMERHIRTIIKELLLDEKVLDRKFEQCSGGEQKRIAIAQELMSLRKPTLLFVDEPTTGLDSNAAHLVMQCLKQLATKHRMTVVTSIHVPSDDILNLFDKLYVLAKGGVCIYSGPPEQLRLHLETKIKNLVIPKGQPPIEVLTKIACNGLTDPDVATLAKHVITTEYSNVSRCLAKNIDLDYLNGAPNHRKSFSLWHFCLLTYRTFELTFIYEIRILLMVLFSGFLFLTFLATLLSSDMSKPSGCYSLVETSASAVADSNEVDELIELACTNQIQNDSLLKQNLLFLGCFVGFTAFMLITMNSALFGSSLRVFRNEHRNQWYSLGVYYWSNWIVTLIQMSVYSIIYSLFGYFITQQHYVDYYDLNPGRIVYFILAQLIIAIYSQSVGQLIGMILYRRLIVSALVGCIGGIAANLYTGHIIDLEFSESTLQWYIRMLIPSNNIFKTIIFVIYGLGSRCKQETEYSLPMFDNHVDPDKVEHYLEEMLINLAVIRFVTLIYLCGKFSTFWRKSNKGCPKKKVEMYWIDFDLNNNEKKQCVIVDTNNNNQLLLISKRVQSEEEIEFEKFSRGKILVAWRNLTLFGTRLMFEQTDDEDRCLRDKAILKNLNGEFRFGTLNALMGTSGAGKTSLLKVLNGRDKTRLSGTSQFYLSKFTRIQTCFITQDVSGHLLPGLTAKQMLIYASRLKNAQLREFGVDTSKIDHQQIALDLLDELYLSDTVNTRVEKCSGGERKRLALAAELTALQMPNLICIDEPTSGLDSNSSEVVMACLRKLTRSHSITIVVSIHQPNTELLRMFDQIYVLARGGVCIYSGAPTTILSHLQTVPEISFLDRKFPIETLIKLSCLHYPNQIGNQLMIQNNHQFSKSICNSGLLEWHTQLVADGIQQNRRRFSLEDTRILCVRYMACVRGHLWTEWLAYFTVLLSFGSFLLMFYDPVIAIPSGCLNMDEDFNNTCTKTEETFRTESLISHNLQYMSFVFGWLFALLITQSSFAFYSETVYFFNEHRNGWYSTGSFYLTKSLFGTFPYILLMVPYCYICNIYESVIPGMYYQLLGLMALGVAACQGLSNLVGIFGRIHILFLIAAGVCLFLMNILLSNLFVPIANVHYFYQYLAKLSLISNLLDALVIVQYGFGRCLPKQFQPVMYLYSLQDSDLYGCIIANLVLLVVYHLISLALMNYLSNPEPDRRYRIQRIANFVRKLRSTNQIIPGIDSPNQFRIKQIRF